MDRRKPGWLCAGRLVGLAVVWWCGAAARELPAGEGPGPAAWSRRVPAYVARLPISTTASGSPSAIADVGEALADAHRGPSIAPGAPRQSSELVAVLQMSSARVQRGYALAQRGALYAARVEFHAALGEMAQALDMADGQTEHSQALAAGMRALDEADDFLPRGQGFEADVDVRAIAATHATGVLRSLGDQRLLPVAAQQLYYDFAKSSLARSVASLAPASLALHGVAKIHRLELQASGAGRSLAASKAVVLEQAALETDPGNFLAANDLAVLWAGFGRLTDAQRLLERTLELAPHATVWDNLARVYQRRGLVHEAARAQAESARLASANAAGWVYSGVNVAQAGVVWVDPATFAASSTSAVGPLPSTPGAALQSGTARTIPTMPRR